MLAYCIRSGLFCTDSGLFYTDFGRFADPDALQRDRDDRNDAREPAAASAAGESNPGELDGRHNVRQPCYLRLAACGLRLAKVNVAANLL